MARRTQVVFRSVPAGNKLLKFGHIFCRSQQEEDGVRSHFSGTTPFSRRKLARIVGVHRTLHIRHYVHQYLGLSAQFARIDKVLILCIAFKRMPVSPGTNWKKRRSTAICAVSYAARVYHPPVQVRTDECADSYEDQFAGINAIYHTIHPHITTLTPSCILALTSSAANSG